MDNLQNMIDELFIFSTIWSVMATCDSEGREKFSVFFRDLVKTTGLKYPED
jgi:Dynein heavy chain AAA lid domain